MKSSLSTGILIVVAWHFIANTAAGDALNTETKILVTNEIREVLEGYRDAMLSRDYDAMIAFWSDSDDFVLAGDGRILGGIDAWQTETTKHYKDTSSWEIWDWQNVQILPLSELAASATVEFRFRWVDKDGASQNARGAWTYVFRKEGGDWKVVQTNGTHVAL